MVSSNWLKLLFVVVLAYGAYRWWDERETAARQEALVGELRTLLREHPNEGPEEASVRSLFAILAQLQQPRPEGLEDTAELVRQAVRESPRLQRQAELLVEALVENERALEQLGLDNQEAALLLLVGRSPRIASGPWAGETLAVGRRLSPLKAPEARFTLANLVVMPDSVAAARMPEQSVDQEHLMRRFQHIGLLPSP